ncbi:MAG TPA: hypothetical protein VGJ53_05785 [Micromonosporaceae bacterium]|jgi:hypothetical protein
MFDQLKDRLSEMGDDEQAGLTAAAPDIELRARVAREPVSVDWPQ